MVVGQATGQGGHLHRWSFHLDTVIVVDSVMLRHHRSRDVTAYVMSIMNMVGALLNVL